MEQELSCPFHPLTFLAASILSNPRCGRVPHDQQARDDHVAEQTGAEKGAGDDELVVPGDHPRAGTVSAQVSTLLRIESSENEVRVTWSRLKLTK